MRILVREFDSDGNLKYVWEKVKITANDSEFESIQGKRYCISDVMDVANDTRKRYVVCQNCNEIIPNTPEEIQKHAAQRLEHADCLKCGYSYLRVSTKKETLKYKNDVAIKITKETGNLLCSRGYRFKTLEDSKREGVCKYSRCNRVNKIEDIWTKYPHVFEVVVTETQLLKHGWRCVDNGSSDCMYKGRIFKYKNFNLTAYTDKNGVVVSFRVKSRNTNCIIKYSKKYDKFFKGSNEVIISSGWEWGSNGDSFAEIIRELYN